MKEKRKKKKNEMETYKCVSAGIFPYSYVPNSDQIYFLVGQEAYNSQWPRHSCRWSDFGGKIEPDETETHAAAREFLEESLGVIQLSEKKLPPYPSNETLEEIQTMLDQQVYTFRVLARIPHTNRPIWRACYVKRIPWQPNIPRVFKKTREKLHFLHGLEKKGKTKELMNYYRSMPHWVHHHPAIETQYSSTGVLSSVHVRSSWLEKQQIRWWSLPQLYYVVQNKGRYKKSQFRMGFLLTLKHILQEFEKLYTHQNLIRDRVYVSEKPAELDKKIITHHMANI